MSNEEDVDLPVAAYLREYIDSHSGNPSYQSLSIREPKENPKEIENLKITKLTKMSDAEEAIKKARKEERQRILDKVETIYEKYSEGNTLFYSYERSAIRPFVEDLRDELEEEVE